MCVHVFISGNMSCHGKGTINSGGVSLITVFFWFWDNFTLKCPADIAHRWSPNFQLLSFTT